MKRFIYIIAFTFLGLLLQFVLHAVIETWYIGLLIADFPRYGFGLSWETWERIHHVLSGIFFVGGLLFGFFSGRFWWRKLYVENLRFKKPIWFRAKNYGWGWTPTTWQGWFIVGGYLLATISIAILIDANSHSVSDTLIGFSLPFILLTALLILICYKTGEKPEWRWGKRKKS